MDRSAMPPGMISQTLAQLADELVRDDDRRGPEAEPASVVEGVTTTWAA
ncbi:hypothetical protein JHN52_28285 [Streptomyces sp. MBT97]|nr:hypothetical protein [Streptomyces sp. MBT97]MBK3636733.1 hypothetical protein [Streptomyces sp. MBT97]